MSSKVAIVARREFLTTIRRKSYIITTVGMPVFLVLYACIAMVPAILFAKKEAKSRTIGLIDHTGMFRLEGPLEWAPPIPASIPDVGTSLEVSSSRGGVTFGKAFEEATKLKLIPYPDKEGASRALAGGEIASFYEFPEDYLEKGQVFAYTKGGIFGSLGGDSKKSGLPAFVVERLLADKVDATTLERVRRPLRVTTLAYQKDGTFRNEDWVAQLASLFVPLVFTLLFFLSIMMSSGFLLQGVSEEKENRVIEVILSSISSDGLLLGKLLGLGGAGLMQVAIWFGLVLIPAASMLAHVTVHPLSIAGCFVFYVLGFLLFGVLLTGTGSLGQNLKESQQLGMFWSLGSVVPMVFMMILITEPNGVLARVLSYIPLTAPVTMFLRLNSSEPPPVWEILLVAAIVAASAWGALKLMAKIFRVGLLLYGKRPTIPEIVRLLRRPTM